MIVIGAKSINIADEAAKKFAKDISKTLYSKNIVTQKKFEVRNIVASASMGFKINL